MNAQFMKHRNMNQELLPACHTKDFFRPIDLNSSCESLEEPNIQSQNKSIFRVSDEPNEGFKSPPTVSRANPIRSSLDDEDMREVEYLNERIISPYPYSPSPEEIEERQHLTAQLGFDWSVRESVEQEDDQTGKEAEHMIDYSFYFENVPADMQDVDSEVDDVSFVYGDGSVLDEDGFCLNQTEPISSSIWDVGISSPSRTADDSGDINTRGLSPAQVSVGSEPRSPLASPPISPKQE
jgi:hypothetical protein